MKIINRIKKTYKKPENIIRHLIILLLIILMIKWPILIIFLVVGIGILTLIKIWKNNRFLKQAKGNGLIYGGRGKGKGLLLNYKILKDKTKPFCNVPYGNSEHLKEIGEYLNSISPLNIESFINNDIKPIKKINKFEGRNVYIDDINVYLPNWADNLLKKEYQSLPPMLAISRHLYNHDFIATTQDRERPYKIIKELQTDFSIKAIKTTGWSRLWNIMPLLNKYVIVKYIYHEIPKSVDMQPFKAKGVINAGIKHGVLTSGQATKEVYEATHGVIRFGHVIQRKSKINYDTRYFHEIVFGYKAEDKRLKD